MLLYIKLTYMSKRHIILKCLIILDSLVEFFFVILSICKICYANLACDDPLVQVTG